MSRYFPTVFLYLLLAAAAFSLPVSQAQQVPSQVLFHDPPPQDGGWNGLANLLEALSPGVDTQLPLAPSEITDRISQLLDQGRPQDAYNAIEQYKHIRAAQDVIGDNVQLLFLEGRALAALGRTQDAITLYRDMTVTYPELPEPWNNLAAEYIKQDQPERAREALHMALTAHPRYAVAHLNMGRVQLMLARQAFNEAARLGQRQAGPLAVGITQLLEIR